MGEDAQRRGDVSALAGKRILVTRARAQAEKTATLIRARGGEPVLLPTIELHPPKDPAAVARALARLAKPARGEEYAWVVFTSPNGVERTWELSDVAAAGLGGAKVAAIGPATEAALAERHVRADLVAAESKGEGLGSALLGAMGATGGREAVLLLRAEVAREVLPEVLRQAGHRVDVVAVYETRPASGPEVAKVLADLEEGRIDAVTFTSASTVESFVALAGGEERARGLLVRTVVASIGPITSEALFARGLLAGVTSKTSTLQGLLDALEARFGASPL